MVVVIAECRYSTVTIDALALFPLEDVLSIPILKLVSINGGATSQ